MNDGAVICKLSPSVNTTHAYLDVIGLGLALRCQMQLPIGLSLSGQTRGDAADFSGEPHAKCQLAVLKTKVCRKFETGILGILFRKKTGRSTMLVEAGGLRNMNMAKFVRLSDGTIC